MPPTNVYLDHCASVPLKPAAKAAMIAGLEFAGNPSSAHAHGRKARRLLEDARSVVAALAGVAQDRVVLTSGATEANAMALSGFPGRRRIVSCVEHESVLANAPEAVRIPVDENGVADLDALERLLSDGGPALVSLMLVNNETGVIQPVAEAARRVHAYGGLLHVDAVQGAGRLPVALSELGADLMTLSAHKLGGPKGAGALVLGETVEPAPSIRGGGQERRRRAGTENVVGQVGFGAAAGAADPGDDLRLKALREGMETRLRKTCPSLRVMGSGTRRVGAVSCLLLPGVPGETQVMALDLAGFSVGIGAACSSGRIRPSHVLTAMGESAESAASAIRVSLGWNTTNEDVERFAAAWTAMAERLHGGRRS